MIDHYILKGNIPVPVEDFTEWAKWFETANRVVAKTLKGKVEVSTVFLGLDHRFSLTTGRPILFETMIFNGRHDGYQNRCSTWKEAEKMHEKACR